MASLDKVSMMHPLWENMRPEMYRMRLLRCIVLRFRLIHNEYRKMMNMKNISEEIRTILHELHESPETSREESPRGDVYRKKLASVVDLKEVSTYPMLVGIDKLRLKIMFCIGWCASGYD